MKLGAVFPQTEIGDDPSATRDFAQAAEDLGYTHILAFDHVLGAKRDRPGGFQGPYDSETSFQEPFILFAWLAGQVKTIEFATGVIILPQRQTALVAKQVADLDRLSGGRLRLGIGTGWNAVEYEALNEDFHNRGKRQEEQVALMRELWKSSVVDFHGKYHNVTLAGLKPLPGRQIPIWFGGGNEAVLKRAARIGDGYMPLFAPNDDGKAAMERLRGYLREAGRDPSDFGIEGFTNAGAEPEKWGAQLESWREMGATHVSVRTMGAGLTTPQAQIDAIRRYKAEVG